MDTPGQIEGGLSKRNLIIPFKTLVIGTKCVQHVKTSYIDSQTIIGLSTPTDIINQPNPTALSELNSFKNQTKSY